MSARAPRRRLRLRHVFAATLAVSLVLGHVAVAADDDDKDDDDSSQSEKAAARFPQPVSVGTLLHRTVLEPDESQPILGHVERIVRKRDGTIDVVVAYGGFLGFGSRPIAVPVDAMVTLGEYMEIIDLSPDQLKGFPPFDPKDTTTLRPDEVIKIGLAKPSH